MTDSPRSSRQHLSTGGRLAKIVTVGLLAVGGTGVVAVAIAIFGMVRGEEFSPDTFRRRSFILYKVPLLGIQISPVHRDETTNRLERYLAKRGLVTKSKPSSPRWEIVETAGAIRWTGDARILCLYLDKVDDQGNLVWLNWSKEKPDLAKRLWPVIAELARKRLYIFIPELLQLADSSSDAAQFEQEMSGRLARCYGWLAQTHQQLGQHDRAIAYFTEALAHRIAWPEGYLGRAQSLAALGRHEQADMDRQKARQAAAGEAD